VEGDPEKVRRKKGGKADNLEGERGDLHVFKVSYWVGPV